MILVSFTIFHLFYIKITPQTKTLLSHIFHIPCMQSFYHCCSFLILFKAMQSIVETIDPAAFEARFSATAEDLGNLIDTKTVTIQRLLEIAPQGNMSISIFVKGIICKYNHRLLPKNEAYISIRLNLKNLMFSP